MLGFVSEPSTPKGEVQAPEADLLPLEPLGERDQVLERAAEPVEAPDDQGVAGPRHLEREGEAGPLGPGAADPVLVDLLAAGGGERVALQGQVLVVGRDPGVADQHGTRLRGQEPVGAGGFRA